jgi:hypothetical protein
MYYRGPGFLAAIIFVSIPLPFLPSPLPQCRLPYTGRLIKRERVEKGVGEEANLSTARKPGPL